MSKNTQVPKQDYTHEGRHHGLGLPADIYLPSGTPTKEVIRAAEVAREKYRQEQAAARRP